MKTSNAYETCTGCALCLLNCPVWRSKKDMTLTPYGRFKAMQWGSSLGEVPDGLNAGVDACTLCGSCEVLCPVDNEITTITLEERRRFSVLGETNSERYSRYLKKGGAVFDANKVADKEVVLVAGKGCVEDALIEKAVALLGGSGKVCVIEADMFAFESAHASIEDEADAVRHIFKNAREVVLFEGLLLRPLREILPLSKKKVISIGERLLREPSIRRELLSSDLYIVDARSYNLDHKRLLRLYNDLKKDVGFSMNLDLHRSAISLGREIFSSDDDNKKNVEAQARWILEGRSFERIVVENPVDADIFRALTEAPVTTLLELI